MSDRASNIKLSDTNDLVINPATEDKQDTIITAINNISLSSQSTDIVWAWDLTVWLSEVEIIITWTPQSIRIQADNTNTGIIFIGKTWVLSNKTNDFVRLYAWDEIIIPYDDTINALYAISDTASQVINYWALL